MKRTESKYFNLVIDKLGDFLAAEKISYELFAELTGLMYWAMDQQSKEIADPYEKDVHSRALNTRYVDSIISGYKLSFKLKEFVDSMLVIPLGLLIHRIGFIKRKIWSVQSRLPEKEFLRVLMAKVNGLENETLDVVSLLDGYSECEDDEDLRKMIGDLQELKEGEG